MPSPLGLLKNNDLALRARSLFLRRPRGSGIILYIGSEHSTLCSLSHGVPQGSILGPALFNIYINDLPTVPESCTLESYVNDSKLFLSFQVKDSLDVATQVNDDLKRVAFWCSQNSLLINLTKTKVLVVGTRQMLQRVPSDFKLVLLGKELAPVPSAKDLGLFVDSTLSFDEHLTITVSSCMASLVQINRVKHLHDVKTLENVINELVFSKLFYCCTVWSGTSKKNVKKLQRVQNFALTLVTKASKYDHITPLLHQLQ